ncbi:MAG: hypothetical protein GY874_00235 [Desulfobacteraceae bacterium]|nr:hypothetical protein [Desulfobacteraceae bacterium]
MTINDNYLTHNSMHGDLKSKDKNNIVQADSNRLQRLSAASVHHKNAADNIISDLDLSEHEIKYLADIHSDINSGRPRFEMKHTQKDINLFKKYINQENIKGLCQPLALLDIGKHENGMATTKVTENEIKQAAKNVSSFKKSGHSMVGTDIVKFAKAKYNLELTDTKIFGYSKFDEWEEKWEHKLLDKIDALKDKDDGSYFLYLYSAVPDRQAVEHYCHAIAIYKSENDFSYYHQDEGLTEKTSISNLQKWLQNFTDNARVEYADGSVFPPQNNSDKNRLYKSWNLFSAKPDTTSGSNCCNCTTL